MKIVRRGEKENLRTDWTDFYRCSRCHSVLFVEQSELEPLVPSYSTRTPNMPEDIFAVECEVCTEHEGRPTISGVSLAVDWEGDGR